ncbi:hypothetical protein NDU88_006807 [Pleurodeles waltl]|uniref:Uncharacterized protein n=1 Tax=Pleurodeles waltl TaxID=8319 RepID=A0AAV7N234_PLEWA|nr:hypothetical protein NDU88_006807 [Pleurodeles waltl]
MGPLSEERAQFRTSGRPLPVLARLLAVSAVLVPSTAEITAGVPGSSGCAAGFPRYFQDRRSIAFSPRPGPARFSRLSSFWWRDLNGGPRVPLHLCRLPRGSLLGLSLPCRRSPQSPLTAHLACYLGVGTGSDHVLHVPIPSRRIRAWRPFSFPLAFRFSCRVSAGPPFNPTALCQRQSRLVILGQLDLFQLPFLSAPGVPLCATGLSWSSLGSGSQDYCAKISGRRELRFTHAAPSASSHAPHYTSSLMKE